MRPQTAGRRRDGNGDGDGGWMIKINFLKMAERNRDRERERERVRGREWKKKELEWSNVDWNFAKWTICARKWQWHFINYMQKCSGAQFELNLVRVLTLMWVCNFISFLHWQSCTETQFFFFFWYDVNETGITADLFLTNERNQKSNGTEDATQNKMIEWKYEVVVRNKRLMIRQT